MRALIGLSLSMLMALGVAAFADAPKERIEADASTRQVAITSSFTGTEILVFGAVDNSVQPAPEAGTYDIIVVVEGISGPVTVRRKSRVGGIWVNTQSVRFASVPSFYAIASTRPADEIADRPVLEAHGIGFDHVRMGREAQGATDPAEPAGMQAFRQALIRLKKEEHLYLQSDFGVSFVGRSLFRATIALPPNVPVAPLTAHVFLFKDGTLLGRYDSRVMLQREGIERYIHDMAMARPLLYGVFTVLMAIGFGFAAAFALRKPA